MRERWERAEKALLGGNSLLSKHPSQFSDDWPVFFKQSNGCEVTDLNDNVFIDMAHMGVGTTILGYANPVVDTAVKTAIEAGTVSTLNAFEEVELAEKLKEITGFDDGAVKFARTGSEANSIAIRLARLITGKNKVCVCGYHGWADWYLSCNLANRSSLNKHLFPQLGVGGVDRNLSGSVVSFDYSDLASFSSAVESGDIAAVIMEVQRSSKPDLDFLRYIQDYCAKNGVMLIFDECTSGFRENFGGLYQKYGLTPDIVVFGKAMGNGYPITAVVSSQNIPGLLHESFISSTFWSERIGPVAALACLNEMENTQSWRVISDRGAYFRQQLMRVMADLNLPLKSSGLDALVTFEVDCANWNDIRQLMISAMLSQNFLSSSVFYPCIAHDEDIIDQYINQLGRFFSRVKSDIAPGRLNTLRNYGFSRHN